MSEENESVGFSCFDTIYLKFDYIGEEEFDDLIEYIEDEHLSYEGATDVFYDLQQENTRLKNKLNNIKKAINGHIDGFITINNYGSCDDILEVLFDLKEVSEGDSNE